MPPLSPLLISSQQRHLLGVGRVPQRRRRMIPRSDLAYQLYSRLKEFLQNPESSWLLVRGMPGCGKSELIAEVLWANPELIFCIVERVIWVTDRHMDTEEIEQLAADALLLASICTQMDQTDDALCCASGSSGSGLLAIAQKLKAMLDQQMGTTLIVLDGVQMVDTVRFFDQIRGPKCKILATSTSRSLFDVLEGVDTFTVPADALSTQQLGQLCLLYGIEENWPENALEHILAQTGGNLALLEKLLTMARGNVAIFHTLVARLRHRPLQELTCHSAYPYTSLKKPLRICMEMLGEALARSFENCCVLCPNDWTNFEIVSLIWPLDVCGSESGDELRAIVAQQLDTIEANSLLDKRDSSAEFLASNKQFFTSQYRLHPLVHTFLLHSRPNSRETFLQVAQSLLAKLRDSNDLQICANYLAKNGPLLRTQLELMRKGPTDLVRTTTSSRKTSTTGGNNDESLIGRAAEWLRTSFWWR